MQSRISCFNRTLFRKNLSRFWPLWGLAAAGGALFPLALLMELLRDGSYFAQNDGVLEMNAMYFEAVTYGLPIISLIYAILVAIAVWSYLYSHRSVSMMHTLPMRREGLFVTGFLSGMAMLLIPYVVVGALMVLISMAYGVFDPVAVLITVAAVIGETFFYFASATFCAFIVSNVFALPAVYFLLHFLAVIADWLVGTFSNGFIFGLQGSYSGAVEYLSPTVYLMNHVNANYVREDVERWDSMGRSYHDSILVDVQLENAWLIAVYACVGVVLLGFGWMLYQRRRSESAGDVIAVGWLRPVFRYGLAALCALLGGLALYEIFWGSFQYGRYYDTVPMLLFMMLSGVIGYFAAAMLLEKSFRVFRRHGKGSLLVLAGCVAVCAVLRFDVFRVSQKVPAISEVESVTFEAAENDYTFYPGEEDHLLEEVRTLHQTIIDDRDYARDMGEELWYTYGAEELEENYTRKTVCFIYELKNGRQVERYYRLAMNRDRIQQPDTYDYLLDQLINSQEMRRKRLHDGDSRFTIEGGSIYLEKRREGFDFNSREAAALLEALGRDAMEGTWGTYDWFDDTSAFDYAMGMDLTFVYPSEEGDYNYHDWLSIRIRPGMTHTIACLQSLGYVTEDDLVTYVELYPEDYGEEMQYYYDKYGMTYTQAMEMDIPVAMDASIGVIGGADGPTAVYVTAG